MALVASQPMVVVVRAESPVKTVAEPVRAAKARQGQMTQALAGTGTVGHLAGELFAQRAGVQLTNVPYKGAAPAMQDLIGGQTDLMFATPQAVRGLIKGGKLRALAVVRQINAAVEKALGQPATIGQLLADGSTPMKGSPEQVAAYVKAEHARWGAAVKAAGVTPN